MTRLTGEDLRREAPRRRDAVSGGAGALAEGLLKRRALLQLLHLVRITDDLLDVARITQNKLEMRREWVDLRAVLQSAVDAARPAIDAQGHALELYLPATPLYTHADPTRLAQVLSNLLNNAIKYTDEGGRIWLTSLPCDRGVVVTVSDTGRGIPPEMLSHVFDMFTSGEDQTGGGLGVGLAVARHLVNLHGGTEPRAEHLACPRIVCVATDPVQMELELHRREPSIVRFLGAHSAVFSFGENYGRPEGQLPVTDGFRIRPTRQPVVLELWRGDESETREAFK